MKRLTVADTDAALLFVVVGLHLFNCFCWTFEVLVQGGGRGLL